MYSLLFKFFQSMHETHQNLLPFLYEKGKETSIKISNVILKSHPENSFATLST